VTKSDRFQWTAQREQAALLVAADDLPDWEIAASVGIVKMTLERWKANPTFATRVQEHVARLAEVALKRGIAQREKRVAALHDRWKRMQRVIEARGADTSMVDVPGGDTGLLVRQVKNIQVADVWGGLDSDLQETKPSKRTRLVEEYAVDTGLLKELREHEKQAAQELGQWVEKQHQVGVDRPDLSKLSDEELEELGRLVAKASHAG
jgi:hypothetical protein